MSISGNKKNLGLNYSPPTIFTYLPFDINKKNFKHLSIFRLHATLYSPPHGTRTNSPGLQGKRNTSITTKYLESPVPSSSMGSLPSPSHGSRQTPENYANSYRIYASFCAKDPSQPDANMCNVLECYDPSNNSWHKVTSIPGLLENHMLKDFSMVSLGDSIYIIGGRVSYKEAGHPDIDLEVLPSVLRYDVSADTWSKCASLSIPRFNFACTVCDDKIYAAGGQNTLGSAKGISSAEVYDPALDEWKSLPNMSTLRYKCVGVTWQGKIHVVGGFAEREDSDSKGQGVHGPFVMERSSSEVYDTQRDKWDFMARMWALDVPPNQIVAMDEKLISSGDCFHKWKGHIEAYDVNLKIWNVVDGSHLDTFSSPNSTPDADEDENWLPIQRLLYLTMAPIGTYLFFLAGYRMPGDASRMKSEVHVFDTVANGYAWRSFEPIYEEGEKELCCHCCVLKQDS